MLNQKNIFYLFPLLLLIVSPAVCQAQFLDSFNGEKLSGWEYYTGDGLATMDFTQLDGFARISVDASNDPHNVWWAIIKRDVAEFLDLSKLEHPDYELRVEAKVRLSHAPRRLNFMVNTQRTTNYHKQLREYDIPDTTNWHVISMTTNDLDAVPGDDLNVQLGVTDWGYGKYEVDIDYYRADIVNVKEVEADKGEPLIYHPPIPETDSFTSHLVADQDAVISTDFPDVNFFNWHIFDKEGNTRILTVNGTQWIVLKWDFSHLEEPIVDEAGLLELTTHSLALGGDYEAVFGEDLGMEFGKIRIIEILDGAPDWEVNTVSYNNITQSKPYAAVFNEQMIYDADVKGENGAKNYITLSRPVLQRLLNGKTKGLLIRPLGVINASFFGNDGENKKVAPKLHFSVK
ncbi:MAG: hypothetical protein WD361_12755 [Gracilimonas sp.]